METPVTLNRNTRRILFAIYGMALLYFVMKQVYFAVWIKGFPDQMAHLSYVMEMVRKPVLLPDFSTMPNYRELGEQGALTIYGVSSRGINYLTHPPLYYHLMALVGGIQVLPDDTLLVSGLRLRMINILLSSSAVTIAFYLGYTRLKNRSPWAHAFYAGAIVTLPMLAYVGASVNNDNLALFALVIFFAGLLRYQEDKTDLRTYLLIGIGFLLGSLSKLTMALICALMLLTVLVMSIIRTRSLKLILNRNFLITLPCYLVVLAYELYIKNRYGAWQPSLYDIDRQYYFTTIFYVKPENRVPMTIWQYAIHFARGMGYTWSSLYSHNYEAAQIMRNSVYGIVYWIPVAAALFAAVRQAVRRSFDRITWPVVVGFFGTMAYNFYSNWVGYPISGYLGAISARYYLPLIIPMAYIISDQISPLFERRKPLGRFLVIVLLVCWLAGDALRLVVLYGFPVPA